MRINKFLASATGISRRAADKAVESGEVLVNGKPAAIGQEIAASDKVIFSGKPVAQLEIYGHTTILLNKPAGYVCSRNGQGSQTIYDLLPPELHRLKPVGRLDKDSSGLLLLTDDGELANRLTHPSFRKEKVYEVALDRELSSADKAAIQKGVKLEDGLSKLKLGFSGQGPGVSEAAASEPNTPTANPVTVRMSEGRNRQIRRTFAALGYKVERLHRTQFGKYKLGNVTPGNYRKIND